MKILITGSAGFLGKNLISELRNQGYNEILSFDRETEISLLDEYCKQAEFVFHLAGINRPKNDEEFMEGNFGFTTFLLNKLKENNNDCPIMISSSIQANLDNNYGKSKKAGEDALLKYSEETGAKVYVYRFPNLYGKWSKPNYNTVVATFCYKIARKLPIQINNPKTMLELAYIDDVVKELIECLNGNVTSKDSFYHISTTDTISLGGLADLITSFRDSRKTLAIANMENNLEKNLYSTYLSFLPKEDFSYELKMNVDDRGSFTEILRTKERGQVSVNISKPGIVKGNHWHHTKNEKFLVVSGKGVIRFRDVYSTEIIEYFVDSDKLEVVDIPVGYTHNIENLGTMDMVTLMWVNEPFDPENPDTYFMEV
ncbi:NAD-dependent epimerase/dehydratase family protein [Enterococcus rotai]|uniref:polysaccharide biosynthesis C-terminal domain-containing protein n=1 Tax=Enterococcus rotai TaxID=118060 RepID=UPI0032B44EA9